jgi:TPP-dependent pyruvate/acetoin dehydrogenase alpha subunit
MVNIPSTQFLIDFESDIASCFNNKQIKAPVHLYNGNEEYIRYIFSRYVNEEDWIFCAWRNHYQALCKSIPADELKKEIILGKSMVLNFPEYKFHCSSIVGGIIPIALGVALANKLKGNTEQCFVFIGDMTAETGYFHESYNYSVGHNLPITWIIEDNNKSVLTPTAEVWGNNTKWWTRLPLSEELSVENGSIKLYNKIMYYTYENKIYPHAGGGERVQF